MVGWKLPISTSKTYKAPSKQGTGDRGQGTWGWGVVEWPGPCACLDGVAEKLQGSLACTQLCTLGMDINKLGRRLFRNGAARRQYGRASRLSHVEQKGNGIGLWGMGYGGRGRLGGPFAQKQNMYPRGDGQFHQTRCLAWGPVQRLPHHVDAGTRGGGPEALKPCTRPTMIASISLVQPARFFPNVSHLIT